MLDDLDGEELPMGWTRHPKDAPAKITAIPVREGDEVLFIRTTAGPYWWDQRSETWRRSFGE